MKINNKLKLLTVLAISMSGQFLMSWFSVEDFDRVVRFNRDLEDRFSLGLNPDSINLRDEGGEVIGETLLGRAAYYGDINMVKRFLAAGADINKRDSNLRTPLYRAASGVNAATLQLLVDRGADISKKGTNEGVGGELQTPLELVNDCLEREFRFTSEQIEDFQSMRAILQAGPAPRGIATSVRQAPVDEFMNFEISRT